MFQRIAKPFRISIHALLAESDARAKSGQRRSPYNFYPRSPCGERRCSCTPHSRRSQFLSTLSLRRATILSLYTQQRNLAFLSTLSLRRATRHKTAELIINVNFYPRSPCGERPFLIFLQIRVALFLSTLSLRRATVSNQHISSDFWDFYPRSPCGERRLFRLSCS